MMTKVQELKKHLRAGQVYRRADLTRWSTAPDRHLKELVLDGTLKKVAAGLYSYPKKTPFGDAPPEDDKLVSAFLKDEEFLITTPNAYNSLGVGMTQLYKHTVVYNMKRHGEYELGGRTYKFKRHYRRLPNKLSKEFLMVDLADNLKSLGEDANKVAEKLMLRMKEENSNTLKQVVSKYGGSKAKKLYEQACKALA